MDKIYEKNFFAHFAVALLFPVPYCRRNRKGSISYNFELPLRKLYRFGIFFNIVLYNLNFLFQEFADNTFVFFHRTSKRFTEPLQCSIKKTGFSRSQWMPRISLNSLQYPTGEVVRKFLCVSSRISHNLEHTSAVTLVTQLKKIVLECSVQRTCVHWDDFAGTRGFLGLTFWYSWSPVPTLMHT